MRLYVGNLSFDTTEAELREAFEPFGAIVDVTIVRDHNTERSRGFGFVTLSNAAEGKAAIEGLHGTKLQGRNLTVNEARPREDRPPGQSGGGRPYGGNKRPFRAKHG
jgi:RNA recognition motif-containing protein